MTEWETVASLVTAGCTLVLAFATFASVRSANRAARAAELSMLAGLRPLLFPSRREDASQKITFVDKWFVVPGSGAVAETSDEAVYLAMSLRNVGTGIAVLQGWRFYPERLVGIATTPDPDSFRVLTRDIYVPANDVGFWQGAFRDPGTDEFVAARAAIEQRLPVTIDVLYGDQEGGQRVISRFALMPREDDDAWLAVVARHWNLDRRDPRNHA